MDAIGAVSPAHADEVS